MLIAATWAVSLNDRDRPQAPGSSVAAQGEGHAGPGQQHAGATGAIEPGRARDR
jgi:hypothetical protein